MIGTGGGSCGGGGVGAPHLCPQFCGELTGVPVSQGWQDKAPGQTAPFPTPPSQPSATSAMGWGRGFISSGAGAVAVVGPTPKWPLRGLGGSGGVQGWGSSSGVRREEALNTTSCSCVPLALPRGGRRAEVRATLPRGCPDPLIWGLGGVPLHGVGVSHRILLATKWRARKTPRQLQTAPKTMAMTSPA